MRILTIIGLPRSGTTMLGRMLAAPETVCYREEPNPAWRYRNARKLGHEQFSRHHATPQVKSFIRARLSDPAGRTIVEKTPANALRTGFVEEVLPEARILFLRREREAIKRSMLRKWLEWDDANALRLAENDRFHDARGQARKLAYVHPAELPSYLAAGLKGRFARALRRPPPFWGPQFEGWQEWAGRPPEDVVEASVAAMEASLAQGIAETGAHHSVLDYEALAADPRAALVPALAAIGMSDLLPADEQAFANASERPRPA